MKSSMRPSTEISAIDLFCGAGGLTRGLYEAGIDVKLGVDIDPACEFPYTRNNEAKFLNKSVEEVTAKELLEYFGCSDLRLLAGCAPCQTFSSYNQKATPKDQRWWLLDHFARLVNEVMPEIVSMENVSGIVGQQVFKSFVSSLEDAGYYVNKSIVNCAEYGIPQQRYRLVLLASLLGPIELLSPKDLHARSISVRTAIGRLPAIAAGESFKGDRLHRSCGLSPTNLKRIRASKPGGSWREWGSDIIANCHKKKTGDSYSGVYGRMTWDGPAPTITTQFYGYGSGRFGHPEQDRAISLREGAILQSFPRRYVFVPANGGLNFKAVGRLIGNAVPVKLGRAIGRSIVSHVEAQDLFDEATRCNNPLRSCRNQF